MERKTRIPKYLITPQDAPQATCASECFFQLNRFFENNLEIHYYEDLLIDEFNPGVSFPELPQYKDPETLGKSPKFDEVIAKLKAMLPTTKESNDNGN